MPKPRRSGATVFVRRLETFAAALVSCVLLASLLLFPQGGLSGAREGLLLCAQVVIPSLFPFLVLSAFVINIGFAEKFGRLFTPLMGRVFRLPGAAAAALTLGIVGGYPVGAKACADLCAKGALTKQQANRLLGFCINSSPAFIIGAVGAGLLKSTQAGILLYAAHVLASLTIGIFRGRFAPHCPNRSAAGRTTANLSVSASFVTAAAGSTASILNICGFVVLFSALTGILTASGAISFLSSVLPFHPSARAIGTACKGFLEVSNGCAGAVALRGTNCLVLLSVFLSWSGLSVIFQVTYAIRDAGLSVKSYVLCRLPHLLLGALYTLLLFSAFPVSVPAYAAVQTVSPAFHSIPGSIALLILCALLLLSRISV